MYLKEPQNSELWEETSSRNDLEQSSEDKKNCIQCTGRLGQLGSVTAIKCRNIQRNMWLSKAWTSARLGQSAEKVKGGCLWRLPHDFQKPRHSPSPTATNGSGLDLHWTNSSSATVGVCLKWRYPLKIFPFFLISETAEKQFGIFSGCPILSDNPIFLSIQITQSSAKPAWGLQTKLRRRLHHGHLHTDSKFQIHQSVYPLVN